MIVAGEASGDLHAAHLVRAIREQNPGVTFSGLGGRSMREAGVTLYADMTEFAVVGFLEVFKHLKHFRRLFRLFLNKVKETKPSSVILVDYPGFNLRLAKALDHMDTQVVYYISPQVWAWKANRIKTVKRCVDKMLVFFPFEKEIYLRHDVDVECVGHPLLDDVRVRTGRESYLEGLGLSPHKLTLGLLPGSREKEIQTLLPAMIGAAEIIRDRFPSLQIILIKAATIPRRIVSPYLEGKSVIPKIVDEDGYDAINACDVCLIASGTATLEAAILQKPMVIVYRTSFPTWLLARLFVKIPCIGLVNVVAGRKVVPECIQFAATPRRIAHEALQMLSDEIGLAQVHADLKEVRKRLGESGATHRAARIILQIL